MPCFYHAIKNIGNVDAFAKRTNNSSANQYTKKTAVLVSTRSKIWI